MLKYTLLLTVSRLVSSCNPGIGPDATIVANPMFTFSFYPPIAWTYYDGTPPTGVQAADATVYPGQQASLADAQRVMQNDIDAAGWRAVGTCVPQIGAVVAIRTVADSDTGTDNVQRGVLRVTTPLLVTRAQWNYIASEVYNQLNVYSKVYFTSAIELN
ncbi:unnamed protein product [Heligmosomoides polygyrus]|uniref:Tail fiber protein n=1 Tax=Heligmosomoides polygyrus TaxID=6339 RepID=A0A3P7WPV5_HELPZ|nr:unnamed protein product [Heligmosomoides polygyrus]